ncbi:LuxR C-terminal-related transcriptional regulator [Martelella mediterranea]|uniref:helix-turn-helix transcriptional regulator n=1 Tax=Martelella mediterranea TaxID=293089 RepID=UPI001E4F9EA3|nr:helix-turn-helix transcriptional regulator [Martelella mediterranea]MCD1635704.1 LuxR C-terminal-related transcriptional regulator [Martelella mediterranea]
MGGTENASGLSDFLLELYHDASECTPDELRLRVLNNLQRFIPFDFGVWGGGWADGRLVTDLTVLNQSEAILGEWDTVAQEDAFCDLTLNRLGATARFDDVPDYRASLAYNEHWRRFDASHMMATIVGEKTDGYVSFVGLCADDRPGTFSDAERMFKQMLMPHLSQALRMNRELWTGRAAFEHEAIALVDREGWVLCTQGPFHDFAGQEWPGHIARLPADVMTLLNQGKRWRGERLDVRMSRFGSNHFVHMSVHPTLSGLPRREREVAGLFSSGMTNKQVARALGTSPSTVRNQIVRIYEKLGISSKAELARLVGGR